MENSDKDEQPVRKSFMCMNVEGAIKHHSKQSPKKWSGAKSHGRKICNEEFVRYLFTEHAKGRKVIPMHAKCGNPCEESDNCEGFDYVDAGCPGYQIKDGES